MSSKNAPPPSFGASPKANSKKSARPWNCFGSARAGFRRAIQTKASVGVPLAGTLPGPTATPSGRIAMRPYDLRPRPGPAGRDAGPPYFRFIFASQPRFRSGPAPAAITGQRLTHLTHFFSRRQNRGPIASRPTVRVSISSPALTTPFFLPHNRREWFARGAFFLRETAQGGNSIDESSRQEQA